MSDFTADYAKSEYPIVFGVLSITFGAILGALFGTLDWDSLYGEKLFVFTALLLTLAFFILNLSTHLLHYGGMKRWWSSTALLLSNLIPMFASAAYIFENWHIFAVIVTVWTLSAYFLKILLWKF